MSRTSADPSRGKGARTGSATGDVAEIIQTVAQRLRSRGERMTGPRRAVLTALVRSPGHPTVEDIATDVALIDSGVHRASVYRTLEALCDLGIVQHVHPGHGATTYHLVTGDGPHLHGHCSGCGQIVDLPENLLDGVARRLAKDHGFTLDAEHVALSGWCPDCRPPA